MTRAEPAVRVIDFEVVEAAEALRGDFEARGWQATRLLWMHHSGAAPPAPDLRVGPVPYEAVHELRAAWHEEDFPGQDAEGYPPRPARSRTSAASRCWPCGKVASRSPSPK